MFSIQYGLMINTKKRGGIKKIFDVDDDDEHHHKSPKKYGKKYLRPPNNPTQYHRFSELFRITMNILHACPHILHEHPPQFALWIV
jgi:hypothetical protein